MNEENKKCTKNEFITLLLLCVYASIFCVIGELHLNSDQTTNNLFDCPANYFDCNSIIGIGECSTCRNNAICITNFTYTDFSHACEPKYITTCNNMYICINNANYTNPIPNIQLKKTGEYYDNIVNILIIILISSISIHCCVGCYCCCKNIEENIVNPEDTGEEIEMGPQVYISNTRNGRNGRNTGNGRNGRNIYIPVAEIPIAQVSEIQIDELEKEV